MKKLGEIPIEIANQARIEENHFKTLGVIWKSLEI